MAVSVIPFIVVQFPQLLHSTSGRHLAVLIALIISVLLLISYCLYQVTRHVYIYTYILVTYTCQYVDVFRYMCISVAHLNCIFRMVILTKSRNNIYSLRRIGITSSFKPFSLLYLETWVFLREPVITIKKFKRTLKL